MRNDTNKLCIALCGPLPGVVERLERRDDVEYTVFSNGCELYDRIEDDAPFDFMVVRSDAGAGLVPLYYRGCDGECFVFLTADTQDPENMEALEELIGVVLEEKHLRMARHTSAGTLGIGLNRVYHYKKRGNEQ